jgi:hypothetical protein
LAFCGILSVIKERESKKMFKPKREEVEEESKYTYLCNVKAHNLCCSPNILRVISSEIMRLARHVARMGEMRHTYGRFS